MPSRRAKLRLGIVISVLGGLTLGITYLATSQESPPLGVESVQPGGVEGGPVESQQDIWQARYQAALASRDAEQQRIAKANETFNTALSISPSVAREYLVSFASPVSVSALLLEIASSDEITLDELFTWQLAPGSVLPLSGLFTAESLNWPAAGPAGVATRLGELLGTRLQKQDGRLALAEKKAETESGRTGASNQRGEVAALQAQLKNTGPLLFGMSCLCTPRALDQLGTNSQFALKAVEARNLFSAPIPTSDPLRDKIIQTKGRYGRE